MSADTNNMSRAVSIINDEEQRGWNLSLTDMGQNDIHENEIVMEVKYNKNIKHTTTIIIDLRVL